MNALWASAVIMGAAGSAHCVVMCGPIALAVPTMPGKAGRAWSTALLNGGRALSYIVLGLAFGSLGEGLRLAGLQRWVSLVAGLLLVTTVFVPSLIERTGAQGRTALLVGRLRGIMARYLRRTAPEAIFFSGMLNGLLPCGLVYSAAIGAAATGSAWQGAVFMALFGAGTVPALVALRMGFGRLGEGLRRKLRAFAPVAVGTVGLLLVLRGSGLDIAFLSPLLPATATGVVSCH